MLIEIHKKLICVHYNMKVNMTQMVPIIVEMMMKTTTMPAIKSGDNIFKTRCNKRDVGRVQRL